MTVLLTVAGGGENVLLTVPVCVCVLLPLLLTVAGGWENVLLTVLLTVTADCVADCYC